MTIPVRLTILGAFCALTVLIVGILAYTNYAQSTQVALATAERLIERAKVATSQNTEQLLSAARIATDAVAALPASAVAGAAPMTTAAYLLDVLQELPEAYSLFIGFADGSFVQGVRLADPDGTSRDVPGTPAGAVAAVRTIGAASGDVPRPQTWRFWAADGRALDAGPGHAETAYDPRTRPWFERAATTGTVGASDIYVFESLRRPGVTVSAPMRHVEGAVVGLDIPLDGLARFVAGQAPGENGLVAILDAAGRVIAHPDADKIVRTAPDGSGLETVPAADFDDPRLRAAVAAPLVADGEESRLSVDGMRFVVSARDLRTLVDTDWRIVTVAALEDFTGPVTERVRSSLLYSALLLALGIAVVVVIANWIARPVRDASAFAERISDLDLSALDPGSSPLAEVQTLQRAMISMRNGLGMFLRYAPADLVRQLVSEGKTAEIGGVRQEVTVMFTDIAGFTEMTERQSPEEVLRNTSEYFEVLTEVIIRNHGSIDKFIGDAIMAMWNAPTADPDHVDHACMALLEAKRASEELNARLAAKGSPELPTRFGLHTGEALVGNMGSPMRMQYTSLGPVVNMASRIEAINKHYATWALVSDDVRERASARFVFRMVDIVEAKGTTVPMFIHELMGVSEPGQPFYVDADAISRKDRYETAFMMYIGREFAAAIALLDELLYENPADGAAEMLRRRCHKYLDMPPPPEWEGVEIFTSK